MDKQPTQEQVKEFWKRYGWKYRKREMWGVPERWLYTLENGVQESLTELPSINLNSIFKYAVPKWLGVRTKRENYNNPMTAWRELFASWLEGIEKGMNEVDALFWALLQVVEK